MSTLLAIRYPNENDAGKGLDAVEEGMTDGGLEIEDACMVTKDIRGKVHLHQENDLAVLGAVSGFALGTFFGWFILLPYLGIPGAILGAIAGKTGDRGIKDEFMRKLGRELKPQSSALFLLLRNSPIEEVTKTLAPFGGNIFYSTLSKSQELELEEQLEHFRTPETPQVPETERSPELYD